MMSAKLVNWLHRIPTSRKNTAPHGTFIEPEEPDPDVLSVPKNDNTGIADGQLSLDIGDLVSACSTEADVLRKSKRCQ